MCLGASWAPGDDDHHDDDDEFDDHYDDDDNDDDYDDDDGDVDVRSRPNAGHSLALAPSLASASVWPTALP
eukprot:4240967-Pyramimonas_sp.AAC.1